LDVALKALNVGLGDEVITTFSNILAPHSSIVTSWRLRPVFADVDRNSQNVTAESISAVSDT